MYVLLTGSPRLKGLRCEWASPHLEAPSFPPSSGLSRVCSWVWGGGVPSCWAPVNRGSDWRGRTGLATQDVRPRAGRSGPGPGVQFGPGVKSRDPPGCAGGCAPGSGRAVMSIRLFQAPGWQGGAAPLLRPAQEGLALGPGQDGRLESWVFSGWWFASRGQAWLLPSPGGPWAGQRVAPSERCKATRGGDVCRRREGHANHMAGRALTCACAHNTRRLLV